MNLPKFENFLRTFKDERRARIEYILYLTILKEKVRDRELLRKIEQRIKYHKSLL